jgi:tungstate transport system substrate-binding protein
MSHRALSFLLALVGLVLAACRQTPAPAAPSGAATIASSAGSPASLRLATTTSTENSGLLTYLLPVFEQQLGVTVAVVAVGTGQALQLGKDGNADVVLVHARDLEDEFMAQGHGVRREDLMYNDFIIVGPAQDPAGIRGGSDVITALQAIAGSESPFISRGDESGTHVTELRLWEAAGVAPAGAWYISAGQGMGAVLTMADEQEGYTLTDRATFLARTLEGTELEMMVEGDSRLFNPYGVIAVNPEKSPQIQADLANTLIDWLTSLEAQELIGVFGVEEFGSPLFTPDSDDWRAAYPDG